MADRNENEQDAAIRNLARAAMAESVGSVDVEGDLEMIRRRAAAESVGTGSVVSIAPARPRWVAWAAAAAVVGLVAAGLVVALRPSDPDTVRTAAPPEAATTQPTPDSTAPPVTEPPATTEPATSPATNVADDVQPSAAPGPPIVVDHASPPPLIEPVPFATLPLEPNPNGNLVQVAVRSDDVVVLQPDTGFLSIVDRAGAVRRVDLDEGLGSVVGGPGEVVYGLRPYAADLNVFHLVAVATDGARMGEVVEQAEVPSVAYTELPVDAFGHGSDGVIDRARNVNATLIGYVDENGDHLDWSAAEPPLLVDEQSDFAPFSLTQVSQVGGPAWDLDVLDDPAAGDPYIGTSPPAPTSGGRVIWHTAIGPDTTPESDFAVNSMPVIAILEPDGTGNWVRLPEEWSVASSDVWGTVMLRTSNGVVELALLADALGEPAAPAEPPTSVDPPAPLADGELAIGVRCVDDFECTQLENTNGGGIVVHDPVDQTLTVLDSGGTLIESVVQLAEPVGGGWFVTVGPDDVAYFAVDPPVDPGDPILDLVAIPLGGPRAGEVVFRLPGGVDGSGDSDLVPTADGLAVVGCCGPDFERPAPDDEVIGWVDSNGTPTTFDGVVFQITLRDSGNDLIRTDGGASRRFPLPNVASGQRGMPFVVATDDGGALLRTSIGPDQQYIVRFQTDWEEYLVDNTDVFQLDPGVGAALLQPTGDVVVRIGDRFLRRTLDSIGTPGWSGRIEKQIDPWIVTATELNDDIDVRQPVWAADAISLAYQLRPQIGPAEFFTAEYDDSAGVLTMTSENLLDDSVYADQLQIQLERASDGLYRFVSGSWAQQCQPNRGQQDFQQALCI